ncbi:MAG: FAD-dependent oxidoreductase [Chloroflexi bacterium]|nr:FAD-dependent oxidoreductase [Chloroflexota bacterium]
MKEAHFPRLFEPARLGEVRLKNRIVMLPMGTAYASVIGEVTQKTIDHYVARARGGVGLIVLGGTSPFSMPGLNRLVLYDDRFLAGHYELVEAVHAHGVPIGIQFNHAGRQWYPWALEGRQPVSASDIALAPQGQHPFPKPRPLEKEEMYQIMDRWAEAAGRAKKVGYDMVEIHAAHGYLIEQFLSPRTNKRTDEYGGSLENRMRFALELLERVKRVVGDSYPIGFRFSAEEFVEDGITIKDSPAMAKLFEAAGAAYLSVSCGTYESQDKSIDVMRLPEGWKQYLWEAIEKAVGIPVIAGGGLRTPAFCEDILAQGKADFIGLARPLLADPDWPRKARDGRTEDIRPCISCLECLSGSPRRRLGGGARRCSVNPAAGREAEFTLDSDPGFMELKPAAIRKRVMVVGGGPAGMEAASIAALRGHDVTLYDKGRELGGALLLASAAPGKAPIANFNNYLKTQVDKAKVKVSLETEVTPERVRREKPDVVVVATGGRPEMPESLKRPNCVSALEVLSGKAPVTDKKVVVVGGGMVGLEAAEYLAHRGNKVTVIKRSPRFAPDMEAHNRHATIQALSEAGVTLQARREALEAVEGGLLAIDLDSGQQTIIAADVVVIALGAAPDRGLAEAMESEVPEIYTVGDCNEPRIIMEAVYEGSRVARRI